MNKDLKIIKKYYGEKMMHLSRELFPTLLEQEGLLSKLILDNFAPSKFLYDDIKESKNINGFKDYIYNLIKCEQPENEVFKTPKELLNEAGYELYECKTEKDIQKFKKYYKIGEELCTFNGGRLDRCHVFFAVKKNVDEIKRKNFEKPERQDEYGTSVISIQFSRGKTNTLSIKNRYNHRVSNPDATFSNNLENIIEGLTDSFEREYRLNINQNEVNGFELPNYVKANDGKFYKYNYEINNIYYCPDNLIIDNFEVKQYSKEKYIILDYFIIDLVNKKIEPYDYLISDCFTVGFKNIYKISIINHKETGNKQIEIEIPNKDKIIIIIDKANRIIEYKNSNLTNVNDYFLYVSVYLKKLDLPKLEKCGNEFLAKNIFLESAHLPMLKYVGNYFLFCNRYLKNLYAFELEKVGNNFLFSNEYLCDIIVPKLKEVETNFLFNNRSLTSFHARKLEKVRHSFLNNNLKIEEVDLPSVETIGAYFMHYNRNLKNINLPKVKKIGNEFLYSNRELKFLSLPSVIEIGSRFMFNNIKMKDINLPKVKKICQGFLYSNKCIKKLKLDELIFMDADGNRNRLRTIYAPNLCVLDRRDLNKHLRVVDDINELYNSPIKKIVKRILDLSYKVLNKEKNKYLIKKK